MAKTKSQPGPQSVRTSTSLLCKLGSIAVHADEMLDTDGHVLDRHALEGLLKDPEVVGWLMEMTELAMVPKKRRS